MRFFKNFMFMALVNIGIVVTLSIVLSVTGLDRFIYANGGSYVGLAGFCLFWGMGGAVISLLLSKVIVKWRMGVKIYTPGSGDATLDRVHQSLVRVSERAFLKKIPEFGVYDSPEMNAFATGPSESNSLVCVSTGIVQQMTDDELEGVLAHEVAHIKNGDMITMTLLQGIVNALVMFLARIIAFAVTSQIEKESQRFWVRFMVISVCEIALGFLGVMITSWFSRKREFSADAGGAKYANPQKMLLALSALQRRFEPLDNSSPQMAAFKISTSEPKGIMSLIATHPPLSVRIEALKQLRVGQ